MLARSCRLCVSGRTVDESISCVLLVSDGSRRDWSVSRLRRSRVPRRDWCPALKSTSAPRTSKRARQLPRGYAKGGDLREASRDWKPGFR